MSCCGYLLKFMSYYIHGSTLKPINFIVCFFVCLFVFFFKNAELLLSMTLGGEKKNRYERMRGERREKEREGERGR